VNGRTDTALRLGALSTRLRKRIDARPQQLQRRQFLGAFDISINKKVVAQKVRLWYFST
jgi:hypothetical protein